MNYHEVIKTTTEGVILMSEWAKSMEEMNKINNKAIKNFDKFNETLKFLAQSTKEK